MSPLALSRSPGQGCCVRGSAGTTALGHGGGRCGAPLARGAAAARPPPLAPCRAEEGGSSPSAPRPGRRAWGRGPGSVRAPAGGRRRGGSAPAAGGRGASGGCRDPGNGCRHRGGPQRSAALGLLLTQITRRWWSSERNVAPAVTACCSSSDNKNTLRE